MMHGLSATYFAPFRRELPAVSRLVYLNSAGSGPTPMAVHQAIEEGYRLCLMDGAITPSTIARLRERAEWARGEVAAAHGALPESIAFFRSVAQALCTVIGGMVWRAGDEVIISTEENPAFILPWFNLAKRSGVTIRKLDTGGDDGDLLERLEPLVSSRCRAIAVSHVSHVTGRIMPLAEISRLACDRNVVLMVDGAQAVGQLDIDLPAIGCDWYFGIGHKWLFGPDGTAFLYGRAERVRETEPGMIGVGAVSDFDFDDGRFDWRDDARRFEFGGNPWPLYAALGEAVAWNKTIGLQHIAARGRQLTAHARRLLGERIPDARILTPADPARCSAILTFEVRGLDARPVIDRLWQDHRIVAQWRYVDLTEKRTAVRLSLAWFLEDGELERSIDVMSDIISATAPLKPVPV